MLDLTTPAVLWETRRFTFAEPVSDEAFIAFTERFPEMQAERDGLYEIVLVTKPGNATSKLNARLIALVWNWNAELLEPGGVYDSDTAFRWPEGSLKGPGCAWASPERERALDAAGKTFGDIIPEIIFELRAQNDTWQATIDKCQLWSEMGAVTAITIDPKRHRVDVKGATSPEAIAAIARTIAGTPKTNTTHQRRAFPTRGEDRSAVLGCVIGEAGLDQSPGASLTRNRR